MSICWLLWVRDKLTISMNWTLIFGQKHCFQVQMKEIPNKNCTSSLKYFKSNNVLWNWHHWTLKFLFWIKMNKAPCLKNKLNRIMKRKWLMRLMKVWCPCWKSNTSIWCFPKMIFLTISKSMKSSWVRMNL